MSITLRIPCSKVDSRPQSGRFPGKSRSVPLELVCQPRAREGAGFWGYPARPSRAAGSVRRGSRAVRSLGGRRLSLRRDPSELSTSPKGWCAGTGAGKPPLSPRVRAARLRVMAASRRPGPCAYPGACSSQPQGHSMSRWERSPISIGEGCRYDRMHERERRCRVSPDRSPS